MENDKTKSLICKSCGAKLDIVGFNETVTCEYCNTVHSVAALLDESEALRIEKVKAQTFLDVESGKRQIESEKLRHEIEKEKLQNEKDNINAFKKSKFSKVLIAFSVIGALMCVVSFGNGQILSGLVSALMTGLFIVSYLMGIHVVKEKKNGMRVISAVIAFVLLIPCFALFNSNTSTTKAEDFEWTDIELCDVLPRPDKTYGNISSDSDTALILTLHEITEKDYDEYLEACINKGFTIDPEKTGFSYTAFNQDGFKLTLSFTDSNEQLTVFLYAPIEMSEIQWPNSDIGNLLPIPESNVGHFEWEADYGFVVYISNTTIAQYNEYVNACMDNGFNIDYNKGDVYFQADNEDGYHISLRYEGNNVMWIRADEPERKTDVLNNDESSFMSTSSSVAENDMHSNLKAFVSKYNSVAKTPITDIEEIDIHSYEYYRVEYRLNGFQNAPALKGSIGDCTIEIVNETLYEKPDDDMRIYVVADTLQMATDIFESFCKATDPEISEEDFDEFYNYYSLDSEYGCSIVIGDVSGYCNIKEDGYDILLKASPDYFE